MMMNGDNTNNTNSSSSSSVHEELQRVQAALSIVYGGISTGVVSSAPQRQQADAYLVQFQSHEIAWMVCDELLRHYYQPPYHQNSKQNIDSSHLSYMFFAAATLQTKIRSDLHQLPVESLPSLRDSLLHHLLQMATTTSSHGNSTDALQNRLAGCISGLAIAMRWTTILEDIFRLDHQHADAAAGGGDSTRTKSIIYLILVNLPEECANARYFRPDDRIAMRDHLIAMAQTPVFEFLLQQAQHHQQQASLLQKSDHHHHHGSNNSTLLLLKILLVWIRFVPLPATLLAESPILKVVFESLQQQPETVELGTDVLVELFRMYGLDQSTNPSSSTNQNQHPNQPLVQWLIQRTLTLPLESALASGNDDIVRSYCRIWTELGEAYLSLLVPTNRPKDWNPELPKLLISKIFLCTEITDSEIASMTLYVWYRLIGELDQGITDYRWRQELIDLYTPHVLQLVDMSVKQLMLYPDDVLEYAEDMLDELHRHRQCVEETVEDCCRLLGGQTVLQSIGQALRRQEQHRHHAATTWQGLEACLACLAAIYQFVSADEAEILPYVISQLPRLADPSHNPVFLRQTCHMVIGRYAAWLSKHSEFLQPLLPMLSQGLVVSETAHSSARAIRELCAHSATFSMAEPALALFEEWTPGRLKLRDELLLLEGVCLAASRKVADDQSVDGRDILSRLAQPIGTRLSQHLVDPNPSARLIESELDRLTTLIQTLKIGSLPIVELIQTAWTLLEASVQRYPDDSNLAERVCRFHKHSIRSCGPKAYAPLFDALAKQLVDCFHATRFSSFLYCASICVSDFGNDASYSNRLNSILASLSSTVFSMLQKLDDFTNHPDVVEEYFYLVERVVNNIPGSLTDRNMVSSLVQCAAIGMQVDHKGANKGTLKFIASLLSFGLQVRGSPSPASIAVEYALTENGQIVVHHLIGALTMKLPCYSKEIPDIIWKLNTLCPGLLKQWVTAALAQETKIPERYRTEFLNSLGLGLSRGELRFGVEAFQDACYREWRYFQQT